MARGWESKSVEDQKESFESARRLASKEKLSLEQAERLRQKEMLQLSRTRVLHDLEQTRVPRRRKTLEAALAHLDAKLAEYP